MSEANRQGFDVSYDASGTLQVIEASEASKAVAAEGGCSAGVDTLQAAARAAGKSEILDQYAKDYPQGPHEKPQSMCPAFGSLRVGLRMKRTSTILSGSACCVYGLTFVSHFYGARRSVGYVPFNSETLVTGKLFEDIREAVHDIANPDLQNKPHRIEAFKTYSQCRLLSWAWANFTSWAEDFDFATCRLGAVPAIS